jgi:hypothetical protein
MNKYKTKEEIKRITNHLKELKHWLSEQPGHPTHLSNLPTWFWETWGECISDLESLEKNLNNPLIGRKLMLDLGSTPVNATIMEITDKKVKVGYNNSVPGREETFSISDFEHLTGIIINDGK